MPAMERAPLAFTRSLRIDPCSDRVQGLLLIVRFAHDRRFVGPVFVVFVLVIIMILIIVVGVSRRHRVAHDGDEAPVDQPSGNVLENVWGHVGSCLDVARHSRTKLAREPREWQSVCIAARSAHRRQKHVSGGFEIRRAFAWARAKSENSVTTRRDCRQRHATYLSLCWAKDEHIPDFTVNVVSPERADWLG